MNRIYPEAAGLADEIARWRALLTGGTYEETYAALEAVVARLELGQLDLDTTLACYELGVQLAARCGRFLDEAELRVTRLDEALATTEPWDADTTDRRDGGTE